MEEEDEADAYDVPGRTPGCRHCARKDELIENAARVIQEFNAETARQADRIRQLESALMFYNASSGN